MLRGKRRQTQWKVLKEKKKQIKGVNLLSPAV